MTMQPQTFEEFIKQEKARTETGDGTQEAFEIERCPTPGCKCGQVHPSWRRGNIYGFRCDFGCVFTVRRNAFTGKIIYYALQTFDVTRIPMSGEVRGMKFNPVGEEYTDWI